MDPFDQLLDLRQGSSSIEYIIQFCEITYKVPFDEVMLKDIFCFGLNEPIKSCLPAGKFNCSLKDFIDYALLCAGSSFTVGVVEEERDTTSVTKMVDAPEGTHKMAEGTTHHQFPGNRHESLHISADLPESLHVSADLPESLHVSADLPESLHVSADLPESLHVSADLPESLHVSADLPESLHVSADLPESLHVSADPPESHNMPAKPGSARVRLAMPESPARMATTPADVAKLLASVPESKYALSASCVTVSSRSQSLPGISAPPWRAPAPLWRYSALSALPWWAPVSSAPPWWAPVSSALPWWAPVSSAPPWWAPVSSAPPWWALVSSAPPWWAPVSWAPVSSAPPWWAPVSSALPWWAPVSSATQGPGPLSLPRFHLRSTGHLYCSVFRSVWKLLLGGGALSRIILTPDHHQRSPAHHIVSCTTLLLHITHGLHFPSTIALITHLSPITHCTDYTAGSDHTLYKSLGLLSHC